MRPHLRFLTLASLLTLNTSPAYSAAIVLDGLRDPAYVLLTTDPAGDIPQPLLGSSLTDWTDLTALYVFTTTTDLYVYVDLPAYGSDRSSGQIGLAIDTTGDTPNSGGAFDPWNNPITYAFTSTNHLTGGVPVATTHTILPDAVIRGDIVSNSDSGTDDNNGWTELRTWSDMAWSGAAINWGGIDLDELVGDRIAFADGNGVEIRIPLLDLGASISSTLHFHFYTTQDGLFSGAYDSLPSDVPATSAFSPTVQHNLTTLHFPISPTPQPPSLSFTSAEFMAGEGVGAAAITITAAGLVTQPVTATVQALPGTASIFDFVPLTTTLTLSPTLVSAPLTVTLLSDDEVESQETILLSLAQPLYAVLGAPAAAVLTILDDDTPPPPSFRVLLTLLLR